MHSAQKDVQGAAGYSTAEPTTNARTGPGTVPESACFSPSREFACVANAERVTIACSARSPSQKSSRLRAPEECSSRGVHYAPVAQDDTGDATCASSITNSKTSSLGHRHTLNSNFL